MSETGTEPTLSSSESDDENIHDSMRQLPRGSKTHFRTIRTNVYTRLMHLGRSLLADNTPRSYNEALEIAIMFLKFVPQKGYITTALFDFMLSVFQRLVV